MFLLWMFFGLFSSLYGILYFMEYDEFMLASLDSLIKIIVYLIYFYLLTINSDSQSRIKYLMCGLKFGILLNLLWCIADAAMYYTTNVSLTNTVFQRYIQVTDMRLGMASITDGFTIRSVGLNNDPATVGLFAIIAAAYSFLIKKPLILILAVFASFACVSFTAIVGIVVVTLYYTLFAQKTFKKKLSLIFLIFFLSIVGFLFLYYSESDIAVSIRTALELKAAAKVDGADSTEIREFYIRNFFSAVGEIPESIFIGTGFNTSSFSYFTLGLGKYEVFRPFDMENTYIATFFDIGAVGLFFFISFFVSLFNFSKKMMNKNKKDDMSRIMNATAMGALIAFLFYHYTLYSVLMYVSIASVLFRPKRLTI